MHKTVLCTHKVGLLMSVKQGVINAVQWVRPAGTSSALALQELEVTEVIDWLAMTDGSITPCQNFLVSMAAYVQGVCTQS